MLIYINIYLIDGVMIIYVLDPPSTMAYIYIYTDMMLTWMCQGETVEFFFFVSRKLIRDFTLILKTHWTAMFHNLKSPEDMYHVVPLYTFIIILIMLFHFRWLYIYTCRLLPNDFPYIYIYIQDTDVIWTFTITLMKNIFTELMVLYGNIHYINILWKLC